MKYIVEHANKIYALTMLWAIFKLVSSDSENAAINSYITSVIATTIFFLLILIIERYKKLPAMKKMMLIAFLITLFQLISLTNINGTPAVFSNLFPSWFFMIAGIVPFMINSIVFGFFYWLVRRENK